MHFCLGCSQSALKESKHPGVLVTGCRRGQEQTRRAGRLSLKVAKGELYEKTDNRNGTVKMVTTQPIAWLSYKHCPCASYLGQGDRTLRPSGCCSSLFQMGGFCLPLAHIHPYKDRGATPGAQPQEPSLPQTTCGQTATNLEQCL